MTELNLWWVGALLATVSLTALAKITGLPSWQASSRMDKFVLCGYAILAGIWLLIAGIEGSHPSMRTAAAFIGFAGCVAAAVYSRRIMRERVCH